MVELYAVRYNFIKMHKTLKMTPALAAEVTERLWSMEGIVAAIDAREAPPQRPSIYNRGQLRASSTSN